MQGAARGRTHAASAMAAEQREGRTRPSQGEGAVPRLPHERDESSDSQQGGVRPVIEQARRDLERGVVDTDRGGPADAAYRKQKAAPKP